MASPPELSLVILCYRSGKSVIPFVKEAENIAKKVSESFEIILVGNFLEGSNDETAEIVQGLAAENTNYKVVSKPKKGMMGWDMKEGLSLSKGRYICVIDGDGQFPLQSIETCFNELKTGNYDLVKTYRKKRMDGYYRSFISKMYNFLFAILFPGIHSKDANSKPKIFTRKAYELMNLKSDDWFIDAEIMLELRKNHLSYYEIPIAFFKLQGRDSFVKFPAVLEFVKNMILYKIRAYRKK